MHCQCINRGIRLQLQTRKQTFRVKTKPLSDRERDGFANLSTGSTHVRLLVSLAYPQKSKLSVGTEQGHSHQSSAFGSLTHSAACEASCSKKAKNKPFLRGQHRKKLFVPGKFKRLLTIHFCKSSKCQKYDHKTIPPSSSPCSHNSLPLTQHLFSS